MKRILIHRAGGYDRLVVENAPDPRCGGDDLLIDVRACGVNYADCVVRMGLYASAKKYVGWPITPGFEVAGVIAEVGARVTGFSTGERVFAVTRFGGYASRIAVPARQVWRTPPAWSDAEAAAFPAVHLTAAYGLLHLAHPRPGASVLVHSAAGGVGSALVQLGRIHGCRVIGVVGAAHKVEHVRKLGAHVVVDKSREALWPAVHAAAPDGLDVVLDANGVSTLRQSYRALAPSGILVVYGFHSMLPRRGGRPNWLSLAFDWLRTPRFNPLDLTTDNKSVMAFNLSFLFHRMDLLDEAMQQLLTWVSEGKLVAPAVRTFPMEEVARAHEAIESGQTVGKLVLVP